MKMSDSEIAAYIDMWLSIKTYINAKDKELACEKFLAVINEQICDLSEVGDEWFGFDSTLDSCLLYTSPSPRDSDSSRMPSSA